MLTSQHFAVLNALRDEPLPQRTIADLTNLSLGTVNAAHQALTDQGLLAASRLTKAGWDALAPHKVDNAIIMAAGMSTRFAPISYEKPKGLLTVKGEVLIERTIRQLQEAGITDITVVVGYKMEQFFYLEDTFGVKIAVSSVYASRNNNSTLKIVENRLGNTYICSADDYFTRNVFEPYVYHGYYSAVWVDGPSDEWGLRVGPYDRIVAAAPGCVDSWVMMGHVYFDRQFSQRFTEILDHVYDLPETAPKLWESIYAEHIDELDLRIKRYDPGVIYEFDSLEELGQFDPDFILNIDSEILDNICDALKVSRQELSHFSPITEGLTNLSFRFSAAGQDYVYRHPGVATQGIIDRSAEAEAETIARDLGLDLSFVCLDPDQGWKISRFIEVTEPFDYHNPSHVERAMALIRSLHHSGRTIGAQFDIYHDAENWVSLLNTRGASHRTTFPDFETLRSNAADLYNLARQDGVSPVLCHNDFYDPNLLVRGDDMYLIDWEYAGMGDAASDLGVFICCSDYTWEEALGVIDTYFERTPTPKEFRHAIAYVSLAAYYWWVWALYKDVCGEPVGEYTYLWYRFAKDYGERALNLYEES